MTTATAPQMGRRERLRTEAVQQIKAAGLQQLRHEGAAGLSLRAVARAVGMSSPGLYRYYASRDELLTALITDVYDDLAQALEQARDTAGPGLADRLRDVCLAYYDWADAHRAEFSLVFGAPVPSYSAPPDGSTTAAAHRFGAVFTGCSRRHGLSTPSTCSARRCCRCGPTRSSPSAMSAYRTIPASSASLPGCGPACTGARARPVRAPAAADCRALGRPDALRG
jgi:AcrR family transcriptional regulator